MSTTSSASASALVERVTLVYEEQWPVSGVERVMVGDGSVSFLTTIICALMCASDWVVGKTNASHPRFGWWVWDDEVKVFRLVRGANDGSKPPGHVIAGGQVDIDWINKIGHENLGVKDLEWPGVAAYAAFCAASNIGGFQLYLKLKEDVDFVAALANTCVKHYLMHLVWLWANYGGDLAVAAENDPVSRYLYNFPGVKISKVPSVDDGISSALRSSHYHAYEALFNSWALCEFGRVPYDESYGVACAEFALETNGYDLEEISLRIRADGSALDLYSHLAEMMAEAEAEEESE